MLLFCPSCSNLLTISPLPSHELPPQSSHLANRSRFECRTCPYQMLLDRKYYERKTLPKLNPGEGDILGGAEAWKNVDQTEAKCVREGCGGEKAYWRQVQIRSADEPMTRFYRCVECGGEWREN
ncbi:RNA polymerase III C11 subunit [Oleoguttula sp. CCFEE 5521]